MLKSCVNAYLKDHGIIEKNSLMPSKHFMVYDNGDGPQLKWISKEIPEPTKSQLKSYKPEDLERSEKIREIENDIEYLENHRVIKMLVKLGVIDEKWKEQLRNKN